MHFQDFLWIPKGAVSWSSIPASQSRKLPLSAGNAAEGAIAAVTNAAAGLPNPPFLYPFLMIGRLGINRKSNNT